MEKLHVVSVAGNFDINRTSFLIEQYIIGTAGMYYYGRSGKSRRKLRPHAFSATRSTIILVPLRFDCDFHPILKAIQMACMPSSFRRTSRQEWNCRFEGKRNETLEFNRRQKDFCCYSDYTLATVTVISWVIDRCLRRHVCIIYGKFKDIQMHRTWVYNMQKDVKCPKLSIR